MPKGYARRMAAKKVAQRATERTTGRARALSNPGASQRSERATEALTTQRPAAKKTTMTKGERSKKANEMLRKHTPAIKKMAAARKAKKKG